VKLAGAAAVEPAGGLAVTLVGVLPGRAPQPHGAMAGAPPGGAPPTSVHAASP